MPLRRSANEGLEEAVAWMDTSVSFIKAAKTVVRCSARTTLSLVRFKIESHSRVKLKSKM